MPVYNEETFNYEILLRFGDAGPKKGKLTGASRTTITQTTKDGVPIGGGTNINPPEQLALIAGEDGEMLSPVLGEVNAATIIDNQTLATALTAEQGKTSDLTGELVELQTRLQSLAIQISDANAEIVRLTALVPHPSLAPDGTADEPAETV